MLVSFQLTMPNVGSWNGKWSGANKKYYRVQNISKTWIKKQEHFKDLLEKGRDSWHHSWNDGWGANVTVEIIDATEAKKRRKESAGFCGYEWMIDNIKYYGSTVKN
jgi:hypothetical protein